MSASAAGSITAVISVMWPSATVKARRESGVASSLEDLQQLLERINRTIKEGSARPGAEPSR